jgi:hypothetical protein
MGPAGNDGSGNDGYAEKIAKRYEDLNGEQKARYNRKISVATDAWGQLSGEYKLGLLKTYANNRTDTAELDRKEYVRSHERERKLDQEAGERIRAREAKWKAAERKAKPRNRDPMEGIRPSGQYHDYGALERSHKEVARQNARMVPVEKLKKMLKGYERVRKKQGLKTGQAEERQRIRLDRAQAMDRAELQGREAARSERDAASRIALAHQHVAERVALEARMLGEAMSGKNAGANRYLREGAEALNTARLVQQRREYRERTGPALKAGRGEQGLEAPKQNDQRAAVRDVRNAEGRPGVTREAKLAVALLLGSGQGEQRMEARRPVGEREALKEVQNAKGGRFGVTQEAKEAARLILASGQNTGRKDGGRTGGGRSR